jgi:hypothetical integral membrane protein (TIGR02206 family)
VEGRERGVGSRPVSPAARPVPEGAVPALSFELFGVEHVTALALVASLAAAAALGLPRVSTRAGRAVRWGLAAALAALALFELGMGVHGGWMSLEAALPLELCDAALLLAIVTLLRPSRRKAELLYFWAGSGTLLAMLTPDLRAGFPRWEFLVFFGIHGLVVAAAAALTFGLGLRPERGGPWRAFLATAAFAAAVGGANAVLGTNFMYLCRKPEASTLLDLLGPWPVYVLVGAGVALALFHLLHLPFRARPAEWTR